MATVGNYSSTRYYKEADLGLIAPEGVRKWMIHTVGATSGMCTNEDEKIMVEEVEDTQIAIFENISMLVKNVVC